MRWTVWDRASSRRASPPVSSRYASRPTLGSASSGGSSHAFEHTSQRGPGVAPAQTNDLSVVACAALRNLRPCPGSPLIGGTLRCLGVTSADRTQKAIQPPIARVRVGAREVGKNVAADHAHRSHAKGHVTPDDQIARFSERRQERWFGPLHDPRLACEAVGNEGVPVSRGGRRPRPISRSWPLKDLAPVVIQVDDWDAKPFTERVREGALATSRTTHDVEAHGSNLSRKSG